MSKHSPRSRSCTVALLSILSLMAAMSALAQGDHQVPGHQGPRIQFEPAWDAPANLHGEALARAFRDAWIQDHSLQLAPSTLVLGRVQESLLGRHYRFQQNLHGIDVEQGELIVSIARDGGRVYRVFDSSHALAITPAVPGEWLDEERVFDIAWQYLRAHGRLLSAPTARLAYATEGGSLRLSYFVTLELEAPYGGWELRIDALSGEVLEVRDGRLYRRVDELSEASPAERIGAYAGPVGNRQEAFANFESSQQADRGAGGDRAEGTGVMFDPDPRATLQNDDLQDNSPPSAFVDAYFTRPLHDIEFSGGLYRVTGPWIDIINWDPPNTPPSTTTDGHWTAVRGDNSFNDAMTYYQIDLNQRYMQSLGFAGPTGIQEGPIGTDTDGVNGADNSYYFASTNRMAFGHGCVDDSEDVDVMLHEYGHAIHYSINSNWGGGDTGAIGEGFGDYWAGSYSYSTPNGQVYHPEWVFSWDGHGTGNQCWQGRYLNKLNLIYNHNVYYGAHQGIPGGVSDELWSTPLFQSLITLMGMGETRESVDQIILESHFGIGYGPKMRDMAEATVQAAQMLQPGGPHALVFTQKFAHHHIIEDLTAAPGDAQVATAHRLAQNSPNPFNPSTTIRFSLPAAGADISLDVYDISGRRLRNLARGELAGGDHAIVWDGRDESGRSLSSGIYLYRLDAGDFSQTRKMTLLK